MAEHRWSITENKISSHRSQWTLMFHDFARLPRQNYHNHGASTWMVFWSTQTYIIHPFFVFGHCLGMFMGSQIKPWPQAKSSVLSLPLSARCRWSATCRLAKQRIGCRWPKLQVYRTLCSCFLRCQFMLVALRVSVLPINPSLMVLPLVTDCHCMPRPEGDFLRTRRLMEISWCRAYRSFRPLVWFLF